MVGVGPALLPLRVDLVLDVLHLLLGGLLSHFQVGLDVGDLGGGLGLDPGINSLGFGAYELKDTDTYVVL